MYHYQTVFWAQTVKHWRTIGVSEIARNFFWQWYFLQWSFYWEDGKDIGKMSTCWWKIFFPIKVNSIRYHLNSCSIYIRLWYNCCASINQRPSYLIYLPDRLSIVLYALANEFTLLFNSKCLDYEDIILHL